MKNDSQQSANTQPLAAGKNQTKGHQKKSLQSDQNANQDSTITRTPKTGTISSERSNAKMKQVHITLQGKGGVGKSFAAALIAQYLRTKSQPVAVVDTDPVNATLAGYRAFDTERLELLEGGALVERNFDKLIERVIAEDTHFVVDNGASSFIPLSYYIVENDAINVMAEHGKQVVIHTVVTGGQALKDTLTGFSELVEQMPAQTQIVVWLNEFFGDIKAEGKEFEEMQVYQNNKDRVHGIITIPRQTSSTFGKDVQVMLDEKMTFDEVAKSEKFGLMAKSRLSQVRKVIFDQLNIVL